jgi:hypothetical protein
VKIFLVTGLGPASNFGVTGDCIRHNNLLFDVYFWGLAVSGIEAVAIFSMLYF